tara:strand:- start:277 stop:411 length:135 start_codon:yes stop_codon:yes gene_type:complete
MRNDNYNCAKNDEKKIILGTYLRLTLSYGVVILDKLKTFYEKNK